MSARLPELRERRLRRQGVGQDPDYERKRRRLDREARADLANAISTETEGRGLAFDCGWSASFSCLTYSPDLRGEWGDGETPALDEWPQGAAELQS